jgi:S1-C subfamily serine protease
MPMLYRFVIRHNISKHVYYITNYKGTHGGTGFEVQTPSGKSYLLTNSHVCTGLMEDGGELYVSNGYDRLVPHHIIEDSKNTDLCLLDGVEGDAGLSIGDAPLIGQEVFVIGHPILQPITMTSGEIVTQEFVEVPIYLINSSEDSARCSLPKNVIESFPTFFGVMTACCERINSYATTVTIMPGSSGSPLLSYGLFPKVIGVMFAGSTSGPGWGMAVSNEDLKEFLSAY